MVYQLKLGGGFLHGHNVGSQGLRFPIPLVLAQIFAAAAIRWLVMPRIRGYPALLKALIIGMVLAEAAEFYGIFLLPPSVPQTKMTIFYLSLASALQFAPFYAPPASGQSFTGSG